MSRFSSDTHPEVERVHYELLRRAGPRRRLALTLSLCQSAREMSLLAVKKQHPRLSENERALLLFTLCHGEELAQRVKAYITKRKTD